MYTSVGFILFTMLCSHQQSLWEHFITFLKETLFPLAVILHFLHPPILAVLLLLLLSCFSRVQLCATPETAAHQAPPSLGFSRQEHWSGLPFPSPMHESEK